MTSTHISHAAASRDGWSETAICLAPPTGRSSTMTSTSASAASGAASSAATLSASTRATEALDLVLASVRDSRGAASSSVVDSERTAVSASVVELGAGTIPAVVDGALLAEALVEVGSFEPAGPTESSEGAAGVDTAGATVGVVRGAVGVVVRTVLEVVVGSGVGSSSLTPPPRGAGVGTGAETSVRSSGSVVGGWVTTGGWVTVLGSVGVVGWLTVVCSVDDVALGSDDVELDSDVLDASDAAEAPVASVAASAGASSSAGMSTSSALAVVTVVEVSARAALGQKANEPVATAAPKMTASAAFVFSLRRWDTALLTLSGALLRLSRSSEHGSRGPPDRSVGSKTPWFQLRDRLERRRHPIRVVGRKYP